MVFVPQPSLPPLPIGVQLVDQRWQDQTLLAIAQALTEITGDFRRPPGY